MRISRGVGDIGGVPSSEFVVLGFLGLLGLPGLPGLPGLCRALSSSVLWSADCYLG